MISNANGMHVKPPSKTFSYCFLLCRRSLRRFLSVESLSEFPAQFSAELDEVNAAWGYHKYLSYTTIENGEKFDHIYAYGTPNSTEEYVVRAHIVQYGQFKSLFEGYRLHMWEFYNAVLFWKSQSPWPALRGALYDYYLDITGVST